MEIKGCVINAKREENMNKANNLIDIPYRRQGNAVLIYKNEDDEVITNDMMAEYGFNSEEDLFAKAEYRIKQELQILPYGDEILMMYHLYTDDPDIDTAMVLFMNDVMADICSYAKKEILYLSITNRMGATFFVIDSEKKENLHLMLLEQNMIASDDESNGIYDLYEINNGKIADTINTFAA